MWIFVFKWMTPFPSLSYKHECSSIACKNADMKNSGMSKLWLMSQLIHNIWILEDSLCRRRIMGQGRWKWNGNPSRLSWDFFLMFYSIGNITFFVGIGVWTQGFVLARQVFYCWAMPLVLFFFFCFFVDRVLLFAQGWPQTGILLFIKLGLITADADGC
jgi:hypothetical protein